MTTINVKRIYDRWDIKDGLRILVDRLWPRGVRHSTANIDIWMKNVAPTKELRKWYSHDPEKWVEFKERYKKELKDNGAFEKLVKLTTTTETITLIYASKDDSHNNAVVLKGYLEKRLAKAEG
ncbi:MAG: DUF488 family protein [Candidatus Marsarchaeota archaeon]|nr:DUF488 family protein [Candidatus Marsarchaeota archaeon]